MSNICPICGYPDLDEPAYDREVGSLEICPSCSFQYGFTDDSKHISFAQWRQQWIENGMIWDKNRSLPPKHWDPRQQLLNIGVKL